MSFEIYSPDPDTLLADACFDDFGKFAYDGFGIWLSDEQLEARKKIGPLGPTGRYECRINWLSGGQRAGKTVFAFLQHADADLYKRGCDFTDANYWNNYEYKTLAIAPTNDLTLRLWTIGLEITKGASDAQYDRNARRARGGAWLDKFVAGSSGPWGIWRWSNGSLTDFRSSEGGAVRLEGGQWWGATWDEWASQPSYEIPKVLREILLGRTRDHNGKIMPMAWPKKETEHHLLEVIRRIEATRTRDEKVVYLSASRAYFTNQRALVVERRTKTPEEWSRTVEGRPVGGASLIFKRPLVMNAVRNDLTLHEPPQRGYFYLSSWDIALSKDSNDGFTFRIPIVDGRPRVTPEHKARVVNHTEIPGSADLSLDQVAFAIAREQAFYGSQSALDATAMGGIAALRKLKEMRPKPWAFVSKGQDRIYGNLRLAAISNGVDCLAWGHTAENKDGPWGLIEMPLIQVLVDQLASFDPDAKEVPDDAVWGFLIGLWYIRRHYAIGDPGAYSVKSFDVRASAQPLPEQQIKRKRILVAAPVSEVPGIQLIGQVDPYTGIRERATVPPARRT